jgi:Protein of unknown function (DUF3137)
MDFNTYYNKEIAPLSKKFALRIQRKARISLLLTIFFIVVAGGVIYYNTINEFMSGFKDWFIFALIFVGSFPLANMPLKLKKESVRYAIVPKVVSFLPDLEFQDIRYGVQSQQRNDDMKDMLFPFLYDVISTKINIRGKRQNNFEIDLLQLCTYARSLSASSTTSASQTDKHLSIHIFADTDTKIDGYALLAPDYAKENDREDWRKNNIIEISNLSLSDGRKYNILASDKTVAQQCFSPSVIDAINEFLTYLHDFLDKAHIQCGFHNNKFLLIIMLKKEIFNLKYQDRKFLYPDKLKHIIDEINLMLKIVDALK